MNDQYEWRDIKRRTNDDKHSADFAEVHGFDWDNAAIRPSDRHGESRFIAYGYIGQRRYAVVFTWRGEVRRIISFRKANPREVRRYG